MIECPNCHKKLQDGSLFCDECGTKIIVPQPERPKKKKNSKIWIAVVSVVLVVAAGTGAYMYLGPTKFHEDRVIAKAKELSFKKDYNESLKQYSKMLSDNNSEKYYIGLANAVAKYMDNKKDPIELTEDGHDKFLDETFSGDINAYNFIEMAVDKYPFNEKLEELENELNKRFDSYEALIAGMNEKDPEKAEEKYEHALSLHSENEMAKLALAYNHVEYLFAEEDWEELADWMANECVDNDYESIFVNDQQITDASFSGEGFYVNEHWIYKGSFKNGQLDGSGVVFFPDSDELTSEDDEKYNILECSFNQGVPAAGEIVWKTIPTEDLDYDYEWTYHGKVNSDLNFDGEFVEEWYDTYEEEGGKALCTYENGKAVIIREEESSNGETVFISKKVIEADDEDFVTGDRYWYMVGESDDYLSDIEDVFTLPNKFTIPAK